MNNNNFTSFSINFDDWSKTINTTRDLIRISSQPFYSVRKIPRRFTSKLVFRILVKNVVRAIWLANGKIVSDVRLNAMLLDVWEAHANQDIYILIRLWQFALPSTPMEDWENKITLCKDFESKGYTSYWDKLLTISQFIFSSLCRQFDFIRKILIN